MYYVFRGGILLLLLLAKYFLFKIRTWTLTDFLNVSWISQLKKKKQLDPTLVGLLARSTW